MSAVKNIAQLVPAMVLAMSAGGCGIGTFISGGGAMRVEVDVYKGPLVKEPAIQLGELVALLQEFDRSLFLYDEGLLAVREHNDHHGPAIVRRNLPPATADGEMSAQATSPTVDEQIRSAFSPKAAAEAKWSPVFQFDRSWIDRQNWCKGMKEGEDDTAMTLYRYAPCIIAAQIHSDVDGLKEHVALLIGGLIPKQADSNGRVAKTWRQQANCLTVVSNGHSNACDGNDNLISDRRSLIAALQEIAWLAGRLQVRAQYWTQAHVAVNPSDRLTRGRIVTFVNLLSQFSGQLSNRADVLLKQLDKDSPAFDPASAGELPLSVYLRDAELSDALDLYAWNRAAGYATVEDFIYHPIESLSSEGTTNRVRAAERVFDDQNWQRINEVFASGRGDVNLVLVKDGIGNWTLKTFDSDPAELLSAYTDVAKTALRALADKSSPDMGAAKKILQAAALPAKGPGAAGAETGAMISELRSYYIDELKSLQVEMGETSVTDDQARDRTVEILRRYQSALKDIRRLGQAGKLPGGGSGAEPSEQ